MRTKIAALITALLIIFVGAGGIYIISQPKPGVKGTISDVEQSTVDQLPENQSVRYLEEPTDTRVEDWLKLIGQEFGPEILNIENASFAWGLEKGSVEVTGQSIIMEQVSDQVLDTVIEFFQNNEFEQDAYNLALDDLVQLYGFTKEELVCVVRARGAASQEEEKAEVILETEGEEEQLENGAIDLEIRCGLVDFQEFTIKKLFSEKYERDTSTVYIDIIQSSSEHISGSVQFIEPDEEQPAHESVGSFLAATDGSGEWVLVFDGNEAILCADIEPYNFPTEMVPECYDDAAGQVFDRTIPE